MEVRELPRGERASDDTDRATINVLPSGKAGFTLVWQAGTVTAHVLQGNDFPDESAAFEAAKRAAEERNIEVLHVERPDA